jgi:hypothetical protein
VSTTDLPAFTCPRCAAEVSEAFYGPCTTCREDLVAKMRGDAKEVEAEAYVPKMNVVPNQIASKD